MKIVTKFYIFLTIWILISKISANNSTETLININKLRSILFLNDETIFKLDIFFTIPVLWMEGAKSSIDISMSFQMKFTNSNFILKPFNINSTAGFFPDNFLLPNPVPDSYESYFDNDYYLPYFSSNIAENRQSVKLNRPSFKIKSKTMKQHPTMANVRKMPEYLRYKRCIEQNSARHQSHIFGIVEQTLDNYGLNGMACISRAICEQFEMELLIESPMHEILKHLLTIR